MRDLRKIAEKVMRKHGAAVARRSTEKEYENSSLFDRLQFLLCPSPREHGVLSAPPVHKRDCKVCLDEEIYRRDGGMR